MILATHGFIASSIGQFDADAVAFFNRVTTAGGSLSATEQTAINTLVIQMKTDGIWTKMKAIYPMVGASAAACAQNLKSSSFTGTFTSGWTFASTGAKPNGGQYMDTQFNPLNNNISNSAHMSFYSRTNVAEDKVSMGCVSGSNFNQLAIRFSGITYWNINNGSGDIDINSSDASSLGFYMASRTSATDIYGQKNSTQITGSAPENRNNLNIYIGARNDSPATLFSTKECAFASIGDGLTTTQGGLFYTAVQAFQTTLSRNV